MVGDPGQLDPVSSADTTNFEAGKHKIHWSAPGYVIDRFPDTPVYRLPVTRRLLPDTSDLVQASFYPDLPFQSVVDPNERKLRFMVQGLEPGLDRALDAIASGQSLVAVTVPGVPPAHEEADLEVAAVIARLADRFLVRQAKWVGHGLLGEDDIGCIDPHVIAGGAIGDGLRQRDRGAIRVDTAEKWQGLQMPISIVRHPLSRPSTPTGFDLEAGRWCVSLSRHQIGCIIVARESVTATIRDYVHGCDTVAAGARDATWAGFEAHRTMRIRAPRRSLLHPASDTANLPIYVERLEQLRQHRTDDIKRDILCNFAIFCASPTDRIKRISNALSILWLRRATVQKAPHHDVVQTQCGGCSPHDAFLHVTHVAGEGGEELSIGA